MTMRFLGRVLVVAALLAWSGAASAQSDILGRWLPPEKDSVIDIYMCGDLVCGKVVALNEPLDEGGKPKVDVNNEDPSLRDRPILGMQILEGFAADGPGKYGDGRIYNPRDGKLYKCVLTLQDDGTLKVRGYVGIPLLGKTQIWSREAG